MRQNDARTAVFALSLFPENLEFRKNLKFFDWSTLEKRKARSNLFVSDVAGEKIALTISYGKLV